MGHGAGYPFAGIFADRLGLACYEQLPATWLTETQFDIQRTQRFIAKQMWHEMIFKAYNRPSVWFRGTANECGDTTSRSLYIADLKSAAMAVDGTRLVAQSAVAGPGGSDDETQNECDVIGFKMYYGVFYNFNEWEKNQTEEEFYDHTLLALDNIKSNFNKPIDRHGIRFLGHGRCLDA